MKLQNLRVRNLRVSEAGQFISRYFSDVTGLGLDLKSDTAFYAVHSLLKSQLEEYERALKQLKAMAETKRLEALDMHRDHMVTTLRRAVFLFEYSDEKEEKNAFQSAKIIMKTYAGLEKENYEAETFDIQRLLVEWGKPEHAEIVNLFNLQKHLDNLKTSAANFDNLFHNRSSDIIQKEAFDTIALKKQMIDTYNKVVNYITGNGDVKTNEAEYFQKILDAINQGRKYFADLMARRGGGKDDNNPSPDEAV